MFMCPHVYDVALCGNTTRLVIPGILHWMLGNNHSA